VSKPKVNAELKLQLKEVIPFFANATRIKGTATKNNRRAFGKGDN